MRESAIDHTLQTLENRLLLFTSGAPLPSPKPESVFVPYLWGILLGGVYLLHPLLRHLKLAFSDELFRKLAVVRCPIYRKNLDQCNLCGTKRLHTVLQKPRGALRTKLSLRSTLVPYFSTTLLPRLSTVDVYS